MMRNSREIYPILLIATSLLFGCSDQKPHENDGFAISYLVKSIGIEEPIIFFFDEPKQLSLIGRRDETSVFTGEPLNIELCSHKNYCVITRNFATPLVVTTGSEKAFTVDGLLYSRVDSHELPDCSSYDVEKSGDRETALTYLYCPGIGIISAKFFLDGQVKEEMSLVSMNGLGADLTRSDSPTEN